MDEAQKKKQLKKHKLIATSLFLFMALLYGCMVYFQHDQPQLWMGYVEAFAEAGMVGALADWFAVTALFRHPLGLPIPHTNLIEKKKNDLGKNLGKFVNDNFISAENIRPYIEKLDIAKIMSDWFRKPNNQDLLSVEIQNLLIKIIDEMDDAEVEKFLSEKGSDILQNLNYQKIGASGLNYILERQEHILLLERFLPEIRKYVQENENMILNRIEASRPLIALLAGKKISKEITNGIITFIEEIENDANHFVRKKLTDTLKGFSDDLLHTQKWDEKINQLKQELITEENLNPYAGDAWKMAKEALLVQLREPGSKLQDYLRKNIVKLAEVLQNDVNLQNRLNNWIRHFGYRMILKNKQEIEDLISHTVEGWSGKELSEKLELEVGKDLQFIRVNGTLVGGLMGLIIYTVTHFFL